jgi:hypothetical protein
MPKWITGYTNAKDFLLAFATQVTDTAHTTDAWKIAYPVGSDLTTQLAAIDGVVVLSTLTTSGLTVYVEVTKPETVDTKENNYFVRCRFGSGYHADSNTWDPDTVSEYADWAWFRRSTTATIKNWLPVSYFIYLSKDTISAVIMGDPNANFDDYLISFGYFGIVKGFEGADVDSSGNFGMTVSSDKVPTYATTFGDKTGTGVTDVCMLKTRSGYPFQAHVLSITTPDEFVDKHIMGPSNWTHKYHMSPAYLFHGVDGYRGEMDGVIVTDRSSVVHQDELIINKGSVDPEKPEKIYKYFALNAPYSMFNNSSNVLYGVAILKPTVA